MDAAAEDGGQRHGELGADPMQDNEEEEVEWGDRKEDIDAAAAGALSHTFLSAGSRARPTMAAATSSSSSRSKPTAASASAWVPA